MAVPPYRTYSYTLTSKPPSVSPRPAPNLAARERAFTLSHTSAPRGVYPGMLPQHVMGSANVGFSGVIDPTRRETGTQHGTNNRPTGSAGNPYASMTPVTAPAQTPAEILKQLNVLVAQMKAGGPHVPAALSLTNIAKMVNALPTHPNIPGAFSLGAVANALTPGKSTPGYVDPETAAANAAQQLYGGAVAQDQRNVDQQTAQNAQNQADIKNWYEKLLSLQGANNADTAAAYNSAISGTGNLGSIAGALGFAPGSEGADTIGQTGSILNAAARMGAASSEALGNNLMTASSLAGVQDLKSEKNRGAALLGDLQTTLNSDIKSKGAAYQSALDAARGANVDNARQYAQGLLGMNQAYHQNFNDFVNAKKGVISSLAALNNQYTTQGINKIKTSLAALNTAAAINALPQAAQGAAAKANYLNAKAYQTYQAGQADILKAQAAKIRASGSNKSVLTGNSSQANQNRFSLAGTIFKTISNDPRVFSHDPLTGATTFKSPKQARADIAAMLLQAGLDPRMGAGFLLNATLESMLGIPNK